MKVVLKWKPFGKKTTQLVDLSSLSRAKQRWIKKVEKNLADIGIQDGETLARDRDKNKQVCVVVKGLNGV